MKKNIDIDKIALEDVLILEQSEDGLEILFKMIQQKDKDLGFLVYCNNSQLRRLIDWIVYDPEDHESRFREEMQRSKDYDEKYKTCPRALLPQIINEICGFSTNALLSKGTYRTSLTKVCDFFSLNYHPLIDTNKLETELLKKNWDLDLDYLNQDDIERLSIDLTFSINKYADGIFSGASYRVVIPCVLHIAYYRREYLKTKKCDYKLFK